MGLRGDNIVFYNVYEYLSVQMKKLIFVRRGDGSGYIITWVKCCEHSIAFMFDWIFIIVKQETKTTIKSRMSSKFGQILLRSAEFPRLIMGEML